MQQPFFNPSAAAAAGAVNDAQNSNKRTLGTFLSQQQQQPSSSYTTNPLLSSTQQQSMMMAANNPYLQQQKKSKIDYIQLPEKVKDTISESEIYSILLNYEHRLDVLLSEKKQHMRQLLLNNETSSETLRILSHIKENQSQKQKKNGDLEFKVVLSEHFLIQQPLNNTNLLTS